MPHLWYNVLLELHHDAAEGRTAGGDIEVNLGLGHFDGCVGGSSLMGLVEGLMKSCLRLEEVGWKTMEAESATKNTSPAPH